MRSVNLGDTSGFDIRTAAAGPLVGQAFRWFGSVLAAAALAACAQPAVTTGKFAAPTSAPQASSGAHIRTSSVHPRKGARFAQERLSSPAPEHVKDTKAASSGLASLYAEGSQTASGEKFNVNELTAAHRTLPFGTRVRITNGNNGRSVVVTINDRGPFVSGRVIDVTPAAARVLGMSGVAPVTLERE